MIKGSRLGQRSGKSCFATIATASDTWLRTSRGCDSIRGKMLSRMAAWGLEGGGVLREVVGGGRGWLGGGKPLEAEIRKKKAARAPR